MRSHLGDGDTFHVGDQGDKGGGRRQRDPTGERRPEQQPQAGIRQPRRHGADDGDVLPGIEVQHCHQQGARYYHNQGAATPQRNYRDLPCPAPLQPTGKRSGEKSQGEDAGNAHDGGDRVEDGQVVDTATRQFGGGAMPSRQAEQPLELGPDNHYRSAAGKAGKHRVADEVNQVAQA